MARADETEDDWDVWAYNDAIKKSPTYEQCVALLERMELTNDGVLTANAVTYHGILDCALQRGSRADAMAACELFERIPTAHRNHHTYATAIRLYTVVGRGVEAVRLLAEAKGHTVAPDAEMIAASMDAQQATASAPSSNEYSDGATAAGVGDSSAVGGCGGTGRRKMSKAERKKAKRRTERRDTDDADGGADGQKEEASLGRGGSSRDSPRQAGETDFAAAAAGISGSGLVVEEAATLPDLCLQAGEKEDVESDEEVAGPAPLRESDIDWGSRPQERAQEGKGGPQKPAMVLEIAKGQVSAGRLDQYLAEQIPFLSRSALTKMVKEGYVAVSSAAGGARGEPKVAKPASKTRAGDVIYVHLPAPATSADILADAIPLAVVFEDEVLVVVNKQPGLTVHPCAGVPRGTLVNALAYHFNNPAFNATPAGGCVGSRGAGGLSSVGAAGARPGIVHRLDRYTSGCIIVAKSDLAHWRLAEALAQHRVDKRYVALVHGDVAREQVTIDAPIGRHAQQRELMCVKQHGDKTGKPSKTICRVRERYGQFTLVELELLTGRTHQIRVHLSHIGHPICGDTAYGGRTVTQMDLVVNKEAVGVGDHRVYVGGHTGEGAGGGAILSRQALHAASITFAHPTQKKEMKLLAVVYKDMQTAVEILRRSARFQSVLVAGATVDLAAVGFR